MALVVKNSPANAGDARDVSSILAWKIPWAEEAGRLQSTGLQRVRNESYLYMNQTCIYIFIYGKYMTCAHICHM